MDDMTPELWDGNFDLSKEITLAPSEKHSGNASKPAAGVSQEGDPMVDSLQLLHADFDSLGDPDDWMGLL
jgi:hypothetical protein